MIRELLSQAGFTGSFLLPLQPYTEWVRRRQAGVFHPNTRYITDDVARDFPWANAWALCFLAYQPHGADAPVSSNYVAANTLYHRAAQFVKACGAHGVRAACANVPIRTLAALSGVGTVLQNAQLAIEPYGSRVSLQAVVLDAGDTPAFDTPPLAVNTCAGCGTCMHACPTGAIDRDGFHWQKCVRAYMDEPADMPPWAKQNVRQLLGCEICQNVCPMNAHLPIEPLPPEQTDALRLERLLAGDIWEAKRILGANMSRRKLLCQAALMAGNTGRTDLLPILAQRAEGSDARVRKAAADAISILQGGQKTCTMGASHQAGS